MTQQTYDERPELARVPDDYADDPTPQNDILAPQPERTTS